MAIIPRGSALEYATASVCSTQRPLFGTQDGQPKQTLEQRAMSARIANRVASELARRDQRPDEEHANRARSSSRADTSNQEEDEEEDGWRGAMVQRFAPVR